MSSGNPFARFASGGGGGGWMTTKKRGRSDAQIAADKQKAIDANRARRGLKPREQLAKEAAARKKAKGRAPWDNANEENDDDEDDMDGFIIDDEEIEEEEGPSSSSDIKESFMTHTGMTKRRRVPDDDDARLSSSSDDSSSPRPKKRHGGANHDKNKVADVVNFDDDGDDEDDELDSPAFDRKERRTKEKTKKDPFRRDGGDSGDGKRKSVLSGSDDDDNFRRAKEASLDAFASSMLSSTPTSAINNDDFMDDEAMAVLHALEESVRDSRGRKGLGSNKHNKKKDKSTNKKRKKNRVVVDIDDDGNGEEEASDKVFREEEDEEEEEDGDNDEVDAYVKKDNDDDSMEVLDTETKKMTTVGSGVNSFGDGLKRNTPPYYMVTTRNRKRSIPDGEGDVAAEEIDPEEALAVASQVRAALAKHRRLEAHRRKPRFEVLCDLGVMASIFHMLDSARDVYHLAFTSKCVQSFVTSEIVVRSAVFQGGQTREAIGAIVEAVKNRSIYVPSALRLLRLANGKFCERLEECWGYDLVGKAPSSLSKYSKRPFGLMICQKCFKGNTISLPYGHFASDEKRAAVEWRVLNQAHVDPSTGERHGPIILAKHVKQIETSYRAMEDRNEALAKVLERADAEMPEGADSSAQALVDAYTEAEGRVDAFLVEKQRVASAAKKMRNEERTKKRVERMIKIFETLSSLLDGYEHKDMALACTWHRDVGDIFFSLYPSQNILSPLFNASSSATQKKIREASEELRQVYDMLASKHFLGDGFLSFLGNSLDDKERALYQHCRSSINPVELLSHPYCNAIWLALVQNSRRDELFDCLLKVLSYEDLASSFALAVVSTSDENRDNLCTLAKRVWRTVWVDLGWERSKKERWDEAHPIAQKRYHQLRKACKKYLAQPSTIEFADDTSPGNNNQTFTRRDVVETIYADSRSHQKLLARDYAGLLALHQDYFRNPSRIAHLF